MTISSINSKHIFLAVLFILLISYSIYEARALIVGPRVLISAPQDGEAVLNPLVIMEGEAKNIAWISLNDRQIFTDEEGRWSEKLLVSPGLSIMTIKARDRFGRKTERSIRIYLQ